MDLRKLKTILDLFENSAISELELSEGEEKLRLSKSAGHSAPTAPPAKDYQAPVAAVPAEEPPAAPEPEEGVVEVLSQMVGTYYSRPSPDDKDYVRVGDQVSEGDVVCIVEAMKLFNNVHAPATGVIRSIEVQNEQPVGYGDLLMTIATD